MLYLYFFTYLFEIAVEKFWMLKLWTVVWYAQVGCL